jgi:YesN/AraC family two-component response regulator
MGNIDVDGIKYNITNDTAIFLPPGTKYKLFFEEDPEFEAIVLNYDLVNDFSHLKNSLTTATEESFQKEIMPLYPLPEEFSMPIVAVLPQIYHKVSKCSEKFLIKSIYYREEASALLKLCLLEMIRPTTLSGELSALCERVLEYIHKNYSDSSLTNSTVAEHFNYHPYHLSRIIKQETGKTLHQYIVYYRIRVAKNYLVTTVYDMDRIAWMSGFCSSAYFIKTFREHCGITPKKYRDEQFKPEI